MMIQNAPSSIREVIARDNINRYDNQSENSNIGGNQHASKNSNQGAWIAFAEELEGLGDDDADLIESHRKYSIPELQGGNNLFFKGMQMRYVDIINEARKINAEENGGVEVFEADEDEGTVKDSAIWE